MQLVIDKIKGCFNISLTAIVYGYSHSFLFI